MDFLHWLAGIRNPVLDAFFGAITYLGSEMGLIAIGLLFFWCIGKKQGYYVLFVGFTGTIFNQFFKLLFRVERPWVLDPSFKPVESAIGDAGGFSFPSGHTQASVGLFGSMLFILRRRWLRILCVVMMVLVPFSRMYLGVHTPADVCFSFGLAILLVFVFYYVLEKAWGSHKRMAVLFGTVIALSVAYLLYVLLFPFPADMNAANLDSGRKNAFTLLGSLLGIALVYFLDEKYLHFDVRAPLPGQILKLVLGAAIVLGIKSLLKAPLTALVGNDLQNTLRYFILVVFAGAVWPLTFRFFAKIGAKKE
ncbi:MAG: phosphatase PAP2 family protein [Clostridia bacterium]|nr:phosphatase PAP2 family protein [Clostridia bacterium]